MKKILLLFIYFLFSCDVEIPIRDNFVVEAFLFQGEKVDDIKVKETKLWNSEDSIDTYINNASVKLYGNGNEYLLDYNSSLDSYVLGEKIEILSGEKYGIEITVKERTATAETIVPSKPFGLKMSENKIVVPPLVISPALPNILANKSLDFSMFFTAIPICSIFCIN